MKKFVTATTAGIVALAAAKAAAQVMYEPFDYAPGDMTNSIAAGGNSPAFGRTNQGQGTYWARSGTAVTDHQITATSLTSPSALPDAIGNKAANTNTANVDRIGFGQVYQSGRLYYSMLLKFDTLPAAASRIAGFNTFTLDAPGASTVFGAALTTRAQSGGYQVGVAKGTATAQYDSRIWSTSDTLFVVGAYQINNPSTIGTDDTGYMWVNPSATDYGAEFSGDEPGPLTDRLSDSAGADLHDAVGGGTGAFRMPSLASFLLRNNANNSQWRVDELRVDTTWAGVTQRKDLQYTWSDAGGGNFGDSTKWANSGGPNPNPNSLGAVAVFGSNITGTATVTTAGETVDTITFDNGNSVTVDGTGLTVSTNASAAQIIAKQGSHTVSAPLTLNDDLVVKAGTDATGSNGATVTLGGSVTEGTGGAKTIGKYGRGTLKLGASNILPDNATLAIRMGTLDLNGNNESVGTVVLGAGHRNTGIDLTTSPQLATGSIIGSGTLSVANTIQLENGSVSAALGGTAAAIKTSQGTARLSGASTYTGDTTIRAGTLLVGADAPSGAAGALGNSTNAIIVSDAGTVTGPIDPGSPANLKNGDVVALLTDAAVTIGRDVVVNTQGTATLGGNSAHNSTFSGAVTLNREARLTAVAGGTVNFTGPVANGGSTGSVIKIGAGTVVMSGTSTYTGGTTVNAGALHVSRMQPNNAVTITAGTLKVLESSPGLGSGHPAGDDAFVSRPSSLTIAPGATLDITNNDVIIDYSGASPAAGYEALVASGYNVTGDWQGDGIVSSIAANDGNYVVAIADNAALAAPFGTANGGPLFSGVDVDLDTILIKFTHRADINLDGLITPDDSAIFGGNYDENQPAVWATGDMNYDGIFTPDDAAIFGGAYDESLASLPEPASIAALALGASMLVRRRRGAR